MKQLNYFLLAILALTIVSCDAVNRLQYFVKNKTDQTIRVHISDYPIDLGREFSEAVDTLIELKPNASHWVGTSPMDIDFPWATKNIYKNVPGICGLELVQNDTIIPLDCTKSSWKYKRRCSTLKIKSTKARQ
jgi:hypothetical protein